MDPITTTKPYQPPPRSPEPAPEQKKPKSDGPTGNAILDALPPAATSTEKASIKDFALKNLAPPPKQDAPAERSPIGHVLVDKLTPKQTWQDKLDEARRSSNPNATIGPIVANMSASGTTSEEKAAAVREKECKAASDTAKKIPIVGVPLANELPAECLPAAKSPFGVLPGIPVEKPSGTALPNTSKEGGDLPWTPMKM